MMRIAFSATLIQQVHESCLSLDELGLTITRSCGNEQERATDQVLGAFRSLHTLTLRLDCTVVPPEHTASNETPEKSVTIRVAPGYSNHVIDPDHINVTHSDLRALLINCAIDAELAQLIYYSIAKGTPAGCFPPEDVEIRGSRPGHVYGKGTIWNFKRLAIELSRSWPCSLDFDVFARPRAQQIEVAEFEARKQDYEQRGGIVMSKSVMAAFRERWPGEEAD